MAAFKIQRLKSPFGFEHFHTQFCEKNALKKIGSGLFASVVAHPRSDECYKISRLPHSGEDAYLEFIKIVRKKQPNPFFPKIQSLTVFEHKESKEKWYVVRMEKLRPLWDDRATKKATKTPSSAMSKIVRRLLEDADRQTTKEFEMFLEAMSLTSKPGKQLLEAVQVVRQGFGLAEPDLHDGNMMLRANGELVITDPIAHLKPKARRR